jgi:hypothetical protein
MGRYVLTLNDTTVGLIRNDILNFLQNALFCFLLDVIIATFVTEAIIAIS